MSGGKWDDLVTRIMTALAMAVAGVVLIGVGGPWFAGLAALCCGLMLWELAAMLAPERKSEAIQLGLLGGAAILLARALPGFYALPLLVAPALVGMSLIKARPVTMVLYGTAILLCGYGLILFRDTQGLMMMGWLFGVVIATDILGYFAGRMFGGPKFWPRISPKKTWSGTVAGWVGAGVIGLILARGSSIGMLLVPASILTSLASQMGDIAESAIKRKCGVKDSSTLLPGHGGLLDRFDGLLGASILVLILSVLGYLPSFGG